MLLLEILRDRAQRSWLWPGLHDVPPGMGCITDHRPDAQRCHVVPPMQFQMPSLVHAPVRPAGVEPEEDVELGVAGPKEFAVVVVDEESPLLATDEVGTLSAVTEPDIAELPPDELSLGAAPAGELAVGAVSAEPLGAAAAELLGAAAAEPFGAEPLPLFDEPPRAKQF